MNAHLAKLKALHDEAQAAGLHVRFWCDGVLVLCSPEHAQKEKDPVSQFLSRIGQKGGKAGTGASKARTPEQARKAGLASLEARRRKKAPPPPENEA